MKYYRQCSLRQDRAELVAYIEEKYAVEGTTLADGWYVERVWSRVDQAFIDAMHRLIRKFRWSHDLPQGTFREENP